MRKLIIVAAIVSTYAHTAKAQTPQLTVDGKTNNGVSLQSLKIDIKVCGTIARTTWQMTFRNSTSRILEGTLNFPLAAGLSVSRYALDINGKMREAVPVERSKGTEVFETIERRRVDPGLLEKVDGNTFRTRIYPINPNNTRTVIIGYEEELPATANAALRYYLPLDLKDTVADFSLDVSVIQTASQPVFDPSLNENIVFSSRNNQFTAAVHKINYVPGYPLSFSIPKPMDATEVMLQEFENNFYYLVNTNIQKNERQKTLPAVIGLLWDASLSGSNRTNTLEIELLDAYFKKLNNVAVQLIVFSNTIKRSGFYNIQNGNWDELKKAIAVLHYDGATNLGNLNLKDIKADEFILVSDGHQTIGNKQMQLGNKPVYCINSAATADYSNLKFIADKTGGQLIDLQKEGIDAALKILTNEPFRFLGIKQNTFVSEHYPSIPVAVDRNFAIAGIAREGIKEIILQFGYGNTVTYEKTIAINTETQLCENFDITKVYAQKKIAELDIQYNQNKTEIERLGRQFGIVTRNTSLIVLENLNDYIQYQVEPPAELRAEYERIMKQRSSNIITKEKDELQNSLNMMATLKNWYDPKPIKKAPVAVVKHLPRIVQPVRQTTAVQRPVARTATDQTLSEVVVTSLGIRRQARELGFSTTRVSSEEISAAPVINVATGLAGKVEGLDINLVNNNVKDETKTIVRGNNVFMANNATAAFDIETFDYIKALKQTEKAGRYAKYLELRQYYMNRPTYFFETAGYFLKSGDKTNGLTILTNLAEMENSNYELYKMLGYKLKEAGDYEGELSAFKKVLELRPSDPQSYRDCALAYLDLGKYQQALDLLYEGMTKSYSDEMQRMYNGIEEIFLTEINHIIALHKSGLKLKNIDKAIIAPMPTDVRVVMNWNKNNTDIDLWVTDPNGEKCFYSHKTTEMGGRISDDFTEGFGPEQFMLKKGATGKYKIQIDYYNDSQVTIAGSTTIMAEIYLHYGTAREEKKIVTLQMEKGKEGAIFVGEIEL